LEQGRGDAAFWTGIAIKNPSVVIFNLWFVPKYRADAPSELPFVAKDLPSVPKQLPARKKIRRRRQINFRSP
jgi:hypothetical protein